MTHLSPARLARMARRPLGAREQRHLDGCPVCAAALLRVQAAQAGLADAAALEPPELSPAAEARAEASIRWTRATPKLALRPRLVLAFGVAAAALAAALVWASRDWSRAPGDRRAPLLAKVAAPAPGPDRLQALVTLVGGEVRLERAGAGRRLGLEALLGVGDRLTTPPGARAAAQWSEGSGFLLFGDSELVLARLDARTQRLALQRGRISVRVGPHEPGESLHVITPDHVVIVHGTWFTVAAAEHGTTVEVLEGTVEVTDRDGAASTLLHAPVRATFGRGRTANSALSTREAARLRATSELNLMPWPGLQAARAASGALLVASEPPAQLAVDGVALGPTPLALRRTLGRHYVELTRPGFRTLHRWVSVGPEPGELRLALVHAPPSEDVESLPVEADELESMVRRRATQIRACYERRLKHDPSLAGTVSLRLRVGDAGQVTRVSVEQSTLPDPLVAECLRREAAGWSFSVGRNATVVYPFVFRSQ